MKLCLALLVSFFVLLCNGANFNTKVLIVGGGMAGISAGKSLSEAGINDIIIVEGENRIGGRMKIAEFGGHFVELGANWIQGLEGNPIWDLKKKYGLTGNYSDWDDIIVYDENGEVDDATIPWDAFDEAWGFAEELSLNKTKYNEKDTSQRVGFQLSRVWPQPGNPFSAVENLVEYYSLDFEFAEPPRVTSLKNTFPNPTYTDFEDADFFVTDPRGYSHLVDSLAEEYLSQNDSRLHLSTVIDKITYTDSGCVARALGGDTYTAEYCLVTVSVGVLENDRIEFDPPLPAIKIEEIYKFGMANYIKIFMQSSYQFWDDAELFGYADDTRGYYPIWQNLNIEKFLPNSNILICTVTDKEAERISLQQTGETIQEIMDVLKHMFQNDSLPNPIDFLVPDWVNNPLYYGCYSNWPIGTDRIDFEELTRPEKRLHFGGEHTHPKYNGYVHGAYLSGIDSANKILMQMNGTLPNPTEPPKPQPTSTSIDCECPASASINSLGVFLIFLGFILNLS